MSDVTIFLNRIESGELEFGDELIHVVYDDLRKIAASKMAKEVPGNTLQPTALVHEAYLRLLGQEHKKWENSRHFFAAAAEAMRRILIERARKKKRPKHGGRLQRLDIAKLDVASEEDDHLDGLLFVHEAVERLAEKDEACAELVKLRFFAGLPNHTAAEILGISERTAKRNWAYARAWLAAELDAQNS